MSSGKMASQAGHAFLNSFIRAPPNRQELYHSDGIGTKVVLGASLMELEEIQLYCSKYNIPSHLIVDSGHISPPYFTGDPIITALGIGPVYRHEVKFLKSLNLIK